MKKANCVLHYTQREDGKLSSTNLYYIAELLQEEEFIKNTKASNFYCTENVPDHNFKGEMHSQPGYLDP